MSRTALTLMFIISIQGCQRHQSLPNALETYQTRIYGVLDLPQQPIDTNATLGFPDKSALIIAIPELNINLREFYAIDNCGLKQLVAQRNTTLGKVQMPSVRLKYEWRLIESLDSCIRRSQAESSHETKLKMKSWLSQKEAIYPLIWANMITQSDEIHLALSSSPGFIDGNSDDSFTHALYDLKSMVAMKEDPTSNIALLEENLHSMLTHRLYARLFRSQKLMQINLQQMTNDISRWSASFVCKTRKDREQLKIVRNVFNKYFVQAIQGLGSQINHYHYALKPTFVQLSEDKDLPIEFKARLDYYNEHAFNAYQEATRQHIEMWQDIFKKCD